MAQDDITREVSEQVKAVEQTLAADFMAAMPRLSFGGDDVSSPAPEIDKTAQESGYPGAATADAAYQVPVSSQVSSGDDYAYPMPEIAPLDVQSPETGSAPELSSSVTPTFGVETAELRQNYEVPSFSPAIPTLMPDGLTGGMESPTVPSIDLGAAAYNSVDAPSGMPYAPSLSESSDYAPGTSSDDARDNQDLQRDLIEAMRNLTDQLRQMDLGVGESQPASTPWSNGIDAKDLDPLPWQRG